MCSLKGSTARASPAEQGAGAGAAPAGCTGTPTGLLDGRAPSGLGLGRFGHCLGTKSRNPAPSAGVRALGGLCTLEEAGLRQGMAMGRYVLYSQRTYPCGCLFPGVKASMVEPEGAGLGHRSGRLTPRAESALLGLPPSTSEGAGAAEGREGVVCGQGDPTVMTCSCEGEYPSHPDPLSTPPLRSEHTRSFLCLCGSFPRARPRLEKPGSSPGLLEASRRGTCSLSPSPKGPHRKCLVAGT